MKLYKELALLTALSFIFFLLDKNRCGKGDLLLFVHQFTSTFFRFWWLSNNIYLLLCYSVAPIIYVVVHALNHHRCFLTVMHNKMCGRSPRTTFNDVFGMVGLNDCDWWQKYGVHAFLIVTWGIVLYKINDQLDVIPRLLKFKKSLKM